MLRPPPKRRRVWGAQEVYHTTAVCTPDVNGVFHLPFKNPVPMWDTYKTVLDVNFLRVPGLGSPPVDEYDDDDDTLTPDENSEADDDTGGEQGPEATTTSDPPPPPRALQSVNLMITGVRQSHYDGHRMAEYVDTTVLKGPNKDRQMGGVIVKRPDTLSLLMTDDRSNNTRSHLDVWFESLQNERVHFHEDSRLFADLTWTMYPRHWYVDDDPVVGNYVIQLDGKAGWWRLPGLVDFSGSALKGDGPFLRGYEVAFVSLTLDFDKLDTEREIFLSYVAIELPFFLADTTTLENVLWDLTGKEDDVILRPGQIRYKRVNPLQMSQIWVQLVPTNINEQSEDVFKIGRAQLVVHVRRQEWATTK
jgi:hypothetical protein